VFEGQFGQEKQRSKRSGHVGKEQNGDPSQANVQDEPDPDQHFHHCQTFQGQIRSHLITGHAHDGLTAQSFGRAQVQEQFQETEQEINQPQ
jgi:hypothetical protein